MGRLCGTVKTVPYCNAIGLQLLNRRVGYYPPISNRTELQSLTRLRRELPLHKGAFTYGWLRKFRLLLL